MPILRGTRPVSLGKIRTDGAFNDSARFEYTPGEEIELLGVVVCVMPGLWNTVPLANGLTSVTVYRSIAGDGTEVPNLTPVGANLSKGEKLIQGMLPAVPKAAPQHFRCLHKLEQNESFTIAIPCAVSDDGVTAMVLDVVAYPIWRRTKDATIPYRAI